MTSPYLIPDLKRDEGEPGTAAPALTAYPDPRSKGPPWTIGWGHTGKDVREGVTWTQAQAEQALASDVAEAKAGLDRAIPWWRGLSPLRQDVFVNMAFNLGLTRFLDFKKFLAAASRSDWPTAKAELLNSLWEHELKNRADRLAEQFETDTRPDPFHPSAPSPGQPAAA